MDPEDAINIAKDSIEIVRTVFELGSAVSDVSQIFQISGQLVSAFSVIGSVLMLIGNFLPDGKHEEILNRFTGLSHQIDRARVDIKNNIEWLMTEHHYSDAVNHIWLGMEICVDIGRATDQKGMEVARKRLENHCIGNACTLSLNKLLDGMTGTGLLTSSSILDKYYETTANGHRKKISSRATRLLQVVSGGIMVIATYETMMYGKDEAVNFLEQQRYASKLMEASRKVQSLLDRCVNNSRENMLEDLNTFLDTGRENKVLATQVSDFMSDKYDWLENFVLVYNDLRGFDEHCFGGLRVDSLHRNGKCGIVFYRWKGQPPRFSNRYHEVYQIVDEIWTRNAQEGYNKIQAMVAEKGIGIIGCAVITQPHDVIPTGREALVYPYPKNLEWSGTFSSKTVIAVGKIILNGIKYPDKLQGATKFLMLQ